LGNRKEKEKRKERIYAYVHAYRKTLFSLFPGSEGVKEMKEKVIEFQLIRAVKKMGGIAPKFTSPGLDGMPDRLVLLPEGKCGFVEVKAPGKKPRALQEARIGMLRELGFRAYVLDGTDQIGRILDEIHST
jgi:hypothetical protein